MSGTIEISGVRLNVRDIVDADRNYITSTWLRSTRGKWPEWVVPMIGQAMDLDRVRVATYDGDDNLIAGYAVGRSGKPLMAYVQGDPALNLRGHGLGRLLMQEVSK